MSRIKVSDLMRPAVTSVEHNAHLAAAAYQMKHANDSALIVIDDEEHRTPIAVITDTDVANAVADGKDPNDVRVSDLVRREPITIGPEESLSAAAKTMISAHIHHLPVVADGQLLGMVDITDACRGLLDAEQASV